MDRNTGLHSFLAFSKASLPQGNQSTGLCACCSRYGDFSFMSRLVCVCPVCFFGSTVEVVVAFVSLPLFVLGGEEGGRFPPQPRPRVIEIAKVMIDPLVPEARMGGSMMQSVVSASSEPITLAMGCLEK